MDLTEQEKMTQELKVRTLNFFKKNNINLPTEVSNQIEDVFDENPIIENVDNDAINIYFKEDLESFLTDTALVKQLNIQVEGGNSSGYIIDKYTYYGELITAGAYSEDIGLYRGEEKIYTVSHVDATKLNRLENPADFCVIVLEETEFHMGQYTVTPRVYIYVPTNGENIE